MKKQRESDTEQILLDEMYTWRSTGQRFNSFHLSIAHSRSAEWAKFASAKQKLKWRKNKKKKKSK